MISIISTIITINIISLSILWLLLVVVVHRFSITIASSVSIISSSVIVSLTSLVVAEAGEPPVIQ